ncbi:hypothetical protein [Sulfurihydrogenibium sp.]|uniref:hypothetical protein n=1 Tax=Sulfurihydrogenibium sp. TaxID=2053621 RepID=UPI00260C5F1C|nr:hypothetical protein [Sulfurihydrogenibium sp.]
MDFSEFNTQLENIYNQLNKSFESGLISNHQEAKLILEKIESLQNTINAKSEEIIKILEDKQKEEKLVQEAKKLLSDLI